MRWEREILIGKDADVFSWKKILASVFCIFTLSGFNGVLNAQTSSQDYARSNQYYQSGQIADRSSFRERLANADGYDSARQNAGTETGRRPLTSSDIWSVFLFGSPKPRTSTPKFVFSRKTSNDGDRAKSSNSRFSRADANNPNRSVYSPTDEDGRLAAMQRASESLIAPNGNNAINAGKSNAAPLDSSESYAADDQAVRRASSVVGAEERRRRIAELNAALEARAQGATPALFADENAPNSAREDVSRVERSKIRQTSGVERRSKRDSDGDKLDKTGEVEGGLPVRPQALRISPRVFVSTEVVQLPEAGALVNEEPDGDGSEEDALVQTALKLEEAPEVAPAEEDVSFDIPTYNSQSETDAQIEAVAPTPLPSAPSPLPLKSEKKGAESRVMRSKASFIDPRSI